jgi:hypothetical protein
MVEWATGPRNLELGPASPYTKETKLAGEAEMCSSQLVHDAGPHQSFSVLGMSLILGIGGIIIVLGMATSRVVSWLHTGHKTEYRITQWTLEDKLQLQRVAYEGSASAIEWENRLNAVPTTVGDVLIPPSSDAFQENSKKKEMGNNDAGMKSEWPLPKAVDP